MPASPGLDFESLFKGKKEYLKERQLSIILMPDFLYRSPLTGKNFLLSDT